MSIQNILLASDASLTSALQQIAKILTDTEGQETTDKKNEIFEILLGTGTPGVELRSFTNQKDAKSVTILKKWVKARSVIDVIDLKHGNADWCFVLQVNRIPSNIYSSTPPGKALQVVANSFKRNFKIETIYAYGDSRVQQCVSSGDHDKVNVAFFMAFKAGVVPQGI